jgi:hypothetical protein
LEAIYSHPQKFLAVNDSTAAALAIAPPPPMLSPSAFGDSAEADELGFPLVVSPPPLPLRFSSGPTATIRLRKSRVEDMDTDTDAVYFPPPPVYLQADGSGDADTGSSFSCLLGWGLWLYTPTMFCFAVVGAPPVPIFADDSAALTDNEIFFPPPPVLATTPQASPLPNIPQPPVIVSSCTPAFAIALVSPVFFVWFCFLKGVF